MHFRSPDAFGFHCFQIEFWESYLSIDRMQKIDCLHDVAGSLCISSCAFRDFTPYLLMFLYTNSSSLVPYHLLIANLFFVVACWTYRSPIGRLVSRSRFTSAPVQQRYLSCGANNPLLCLSGQPVIISPGKEHKKIQI